MRTPSRALAVGSVALYLALAACGITVHTGSTAQSIARPLTQARLRSILLKAGAIGADFELSPSNGPGDYDMICLTSMWNFVGPGGAEPVTTTTRQIAAKQGYFPDLSEGLAVYSTKQDAAFALSAYEKETAGCDRTAIRNGDSLTSYRVTIDEDRSAPDVDGQLNIAEIGRVRYDGDKKTYDTGTWFTLMRIGKVVVMTAYDGGGPKDDGSVDQLNRALLTRVLAVLDGQPVPPISPLGWTTDQQGNAPSA
ncbi:MAG: hypothetical protein JWQ32_1531 [Marmoricola sp.]|nr:hypothetical protein [Marmoricola sp.]